MCVCVFFLFLFLNVDHLKNRLPKDSLCVCMRVCTCVRGINGAAKAWGESEIWSLFKSERTAAF